MANINTKTPLGSGTTDVKEQRAISDAAMEKRHEMFDLQAQDNTMKYERPSFSVVGEQTRSSNQKYAEGYERIDWTK